MGVWQYARHLRARGFEPWHGKSNGNRAYTRTLANGNTEFWSYSTHVLTIADIGLGFPIVVEDYGRFSSTTARHESQWLRETGAARMRGWRLKRKRWE